ncbi:MAG TPA: glycoside hydrolase family 104 protein [Ottowia sp.]|nr:glycoside hydrolase family 104 protein [Ottowia sp.]
MTPAELRQICADALRSTNLRAFLDVIRAGEGTADADGYRRHFGGELFASFADHPRRAVTRSLGGKPITSTAAGAYQFLGRTWDECAQALALPDFTAASQDLAAAFLIRRRGALADVLAGRVEAAIGKCNREWASLPGSPYGQPTRTLAQALATYAAAGGKEAPSTTTAEARAATPPATPPAAAPTTKARFSVPPFLLAALPALIEAIPKLGKLFGSGSDVQQRNLAAVQTVAEIVQGATGARNIQEAVEAMQADAGALQAATRAVEAQWFEISEAGGGGIAGAREADAAFASKSRLRDSPAFWALLCLLPLAYMIVGSIVGLWGGAVWSDEVRAAIATAAISLIVGGAAGYYWGGTTTANGAARK